MTSWKRTNPYVDDIAKANTLAIIYSMQFLGRKLVGWLGLTSDYSYAVSYYRRSETHPLRMVQRYVITILIFYGGGWLPHFGTPRAIIWMRIWRTLHSRLILDAPGTISVHGGVSPSEPWTRALRSGDECFKDRAIRTAELLEYFINSIILILYLVKLP